MHDTRVRRRTGSLVSACYYVASSRRPVGVVFNGVQHSAKIQIAGSKNVRSVILSDIRQLQCAQTLLSCRAVCAVPVRARYQGEFS